MSTSSPIKPKRLKWLLVVILLVLVAFVLGYFYLQQLERNGTRVSFASAGSGAASGSALLIEPSAELAAEGFVCSDPSASQEVEAILFVRMEKHAARFHAATTGAALKVSGLRYALLDGNGVELGTGPLDLTGDLQRGESRPCEIKDARLREARSIVISR